MTNVILEDCKERVYAPDQVRHLLSQIRIGPLDDKFSPIPCWCLVRARQGVEELVHGLFIVRGDNMCARSASPCCFAVWAPSRRVAGDETGHLTLLSPLLQRISGASRRGG